MDLFTTDDSHDAIEMCPAVGVLDIGAVRNMRLGRRRGSRHVAFTAD
jgi:hypothetical protein